MALVKQHWWWMVGALCGAVLLAGPSLGWAKEKKPTPPPAVKPDQRVQEAQSRLNGTEWTIQVTPLGGTQPKYPEADTLRFEKGKVSSKQLDNAGFMATNYTLTVGDDGVPVWETMQTSGDTSVALWRGQIHGETMRGMFSKHSAQGEITDSAFSGKFVGPIASSAPPPASVAPVTPEDPVPPASSAVPPVAASTPAAPSTTEDMKK